MVETIAKQKMKQHEPVAASDQTYKQINDILEEYSIASHQK